MTGYMSQRIKELRKEKGLTLEQVADIVGVGKSTVRKWETGMIANMKRDKIANLAKALGTTPAYLMGWVENEDQEIVSPDNVELTEGEKKWLELYHKLPNETRDTFTVMADAFMKMPTDTQIVLRDMFLGALNNRK